MGKTIKYFISFILVIAYTSCCKDKNEGCKSDSVIVAPFLLRFNYYDCVTNNQPFEHIFWNTDQIDSLQDSCYFNGSAVYPLNHLPNLYMVCADSLIDYTDTIIAEVFKDTCKKEINYH